MRAIRRLSVRGRARLGAGLLALAAAGDNEPLVESPCAVAGAEVALYEGSRLFEAPGARLDLVRGWPLSCTQPSARRVLDTLRAALSRFPRERLRSPLRVHLDPRLPARHAPLGGVEVHVTSREILVASARLDAFGPEVWRHELLHTLAAPPPPGPADARRLWLTLEEALVGLLAASLPLAPNGALAPLESSSPPNAPGGGSPIPAAPRPGMAPLPPAPLPASAWLASPGYDPHPLASGLTRTLQKAAPRPDLDAWLRCLETPALPPAPAPAPPSARSGQLARVLRRFAERCPPGVAPELRQALERWWGEPHGGRSPASAVATVTGSAAPPRQSR